MVRTCANEPKDICREASPVFTAPNAWGPNGRMVVTEGVTCSCATNMCNSHPWETIFNSASATTGRSTGDASTVNTDLTTKKSDGLNLTVIRGIATQKSVLESSTQNNNGVRCVMISETYILIPIISSIVTTFFERFQDWNYTIVSLIWRWNC